MVLPRTETSDGQAMLIVRYRYRVRLAESLHGDARGDDENRCVRGGAEVVIKYLSYDLKYVAKFHRENENLLERVYVANRRKYQIE